MVFRLLSCSAMGFQGLIKAQVTIPMDSNVPADAATNTFWFVTSDLTEPTPVQYQTVKAHLGTFYQSVVPIMSADVNPAGMSVKMYHWVGPQPINPALSENMGITAVTGGLIGVAEAAICLSFHAPLNQPGIPNARRRGRVYIGPLAGTSGRFVANGDQAIVKNAAAAMLQNANGAPPNGPNGIRWCVYSETNNGGPWVSGGWVDNAWDIQRRRGVKATVRSLFP